MITRSPLVVNSWVDIRKGCDYTYSICDGENVYFAVSGDGQQPFEVVFDSDALREFLEHGGRALAELEIAATLKDVE